MEIRNGQIYIGGVSVKELADQYGTPTYVYDEEKIRSNFRKSRVRTTPVRTPRPAAWLAYMRMYSPSIKVIRGS